MLATSIAHYLQHLIKESARPELEGLDSANKHPQLDFAPHETSWHCVRAVISDLLPIHEALKHFYK